MQREDPGWIWPAPQLAANIGLSHQVLTYSSDTAGSLGTGLGFVGDAADVDELLVIVDAPAAPMDDGSIQHKCTAHGAGLGCLGRLRSTHAMASSESPSWASITCGFYESIDDIFCAREVLPKIRVRGRSSTTHPHSSACLVSNDR